MPINVAHSLNMLKVLRRMDLNTTRYRKLLTKVLDNIIHMARNLNDGGTALSFPNSIPIIYTITGIFITISVKHIINTFLPERIALEVGEDIFPPYSDEIELVCCAICR